MVDISYWEKNEKKSKKFLKNLYNFTSANFRLVIKQKTRKIRTLLPVKEKTLFPSYKMYYDICNCGIIPVKPNEILRQDGRNITIQSTIQN